MPFVIMTGYSQKEFSKIKPDKISRCCFLCKRTEIDHSVAFCNGTVINPKIELMPFSINVIDSDLVASFLLCNECYFIMSSFCHPGIEHEIKNREKLSFFS